MTIKATQDQLLLNALNTLDIHDQYRSALEEARTVRDSRVALFVKRQLENFEQQTFGRILNGQEKDGVAEEMVQKTSDKRVKDRRQK